MRVGLHFHTRLFGSSRYTVGVRGETQVLHGARTFSGYCDRCAGGGGAAYAMAFVYTVFSMRSPCVPGRGPWITFIRDGMVKTGDPTFTVGLRGVGRLATRSVTNIGTTVLRRLGSSIRLVGRLNCCVIDNNNGHVHPVVTMLTTQTINCRKGTRIAVTTLVRFVRATALLRSSIISRSSVHENGTATGTTFNGTTDILMNSFVCAHTFRVVADLNSLGILRIVSRTMGIVTRNRILRLVGIGSPSVARRGCVHIVCDGATHLFRTTTRYSKVLTNYAPRRRGNLRSCKHCLNATFRLVSSLLSCGTSNRRLNGGINSSLGRNGPALPLLRTVRRNAPRRTRVVHATVRRNGNHRLLRPILRTVGTYKSLR